MLPQKSHSSKYDLTFGGSTERSARVLYVNRVGFLGGVERVLITLAAGVEDFGYKPLLVCPENGELAAAARAEGIEVSTFWFNRMRITRNPFIVGRYPIDWWRSARFILREATRIDATIIHVHHPVGALYAIPAVRKLQLPMVLHVHEGPPIKPIYALALRVAVRYADAIICVSNSAREVADSVRPNPNKVKVVHNGVDRSFLEKEHTPTPEVSGPGPHIGIFGVIEPRKGQDVFLRAAEKLSKRFPTAHFWIVGSLALADKAGFQRALEDQIDRANLGGRVTFTGFRPDVARWMMAMDVVTLTSVAHESLGMVLIEALALGRNVVASNSGGISEIIRDGVNGRLVQPGDFRALAETITAALETGTPPRGAQAFIDVRERFSPTTFCRQVGAIYDGLLKRGTDDKTMSASTLGDKT
jgi:glycosyltransferase involved in cell wall biosynthesis